MCPLQPYTKGQDCMLCLDDQGFPEPRWAQRAAARRQQVRENVRAFRQRTRQRALQQVQAEGSVSETTGSTSRRNSSTGSEPASSSQAVAQNQSDQLQRIRLTSTPDGKGIKWSLGLPLRIDMGPAYANAFIAAFVDRSTPPGPHTPDLAALTLHSPLPEGEEPALPEAAILSSPTSLRMGVGSGVPSISETFIRVEICCCGKWTTAVTFESLSPGSEMLREALLATALNLLGIEKKDPRMSVHGMHIQGRALRKLREGFDAYVKNNEKDKAALLSATAMTISISELLVDKSWEGFALHLKGVGALIEHAGPASLDAETARAHFYGYRTAQLPFAILDRRSTFLARPEWIDHPWRDKGSEVDNNDALHSLLDIGYQIPNQLEFYDNSVTRSPGALRRQMKKLNKIASSLNNWKLDLLEEHSSNIYSTQPAVWGGLHTEIMNFHNDTIANCFTLYAALRVALFSLVRQLAEDLKDEDESSWPVLRGAIGESFKWSRIACQCLEFYFATGRIVMGKIYCLLAFDCAWATFIELKEKHQMDMEHELLFCKSAADKLATDGLPLFKLR